MSGEFANLNELWSRIIAETLQAKGIRFAVICPGSRSSPLAFAFARTNGIEAISILDERSAGFFALGLAKREGVAVVLVCTSGTAAANFYPAIIEASESGVPLVALTADRPHELRGCRAGQTIVQQGLYASYPVSQVELPIPTSDSAALETLKNSISEQADRSMAFPSGPIHINAPFRDPLPPISDGGFDSPIPMSELSVFCDERSSRPIQVEACDLTEFANTERGAILVGSPLAPISEDWIENVGRLADRLKWPVLSDGLNPLRANAQRFPRLISGYNAICRLVDAESGLLPERILVIGDLPISKTLREWLGRHAIRSLFLAPLEGEFDPNRGDSETRLFDFSRATPTAPLFNSDEFASKWKATDERVRALLQAEITQCDSLFEGSVAATLSKRLPSNSALFVSNSMPPRDMEFFWEPNDGGTQIYCSRGANGIDGILSTAVGIAHRGKQTFLLTGDLALLHDSNGGLIGKVFDGSLTIVLINNSGGGIFEMLPVAQMGDEFETYFATDQSVEFSKWASTYDIGYTSIDSLSELEVQVTAAPAKGIRLLEIKTDRKADAAFRKHVFASIADALGAL